MFTVRVCSTYDGRLCFHRCVSVQLSGGEVTPSQVWGQAGGAGYPIPGLDGGGYPGIPPSPGVDGGGTLSQVWMGGYLRYPPP